MNTLYFENPILCCYFCSRISMYILEQILDTINKCSEDEILYTSILVMILAQSFMAMQRHIKQLLIIT